MSRRPVLVALSALAAGFAALADDAPGLTDGETRVASVSPVQALAPTFEQLLAAMPPPPRTAEMKTNYYGVIRLDHQAHLARKAACRACHGTGPVTKIALAPKVAHERCIGCHTQQGAGPTSCKACHDTTPPPTAEAVTQAVPAATAKQEPPTSEQLALLESTEHGPGTFTELKERRSLSRVLETGGTAGHGFGLSLRLSSRSDDLEISHAVDRIVGSEEAHTMGLFGVGLVRPVGRRFAVVGAALGGFDVIDQPGVAFLPALGARVGVEWAPPRAWWLRRFQLSLTGLADLGRAQFGAQQVGGWTGYLTLSTGVGLSGDGP